MILPNRSPVDFSKIVDIRCLSGLDTTANLLGTLKHSAKEGRVEVFYSTAKNPIAYVAWAEVNKESMSLMTKRKKMPAYPYEWNEGKFIVVYDIVFIPNWGDLARAKTLSFLFQHRFFAYLRRDRLHVFSRVNSRHKRTLF
jgi:hemolysin-activating ACP:hemolysin acyltransferase